MSYSLRLKNPVSDETLRLPEHYMYGTNVRVDEYGRPLPSDMADLDITYNYSGYYYRVTEGDPRFANEYVSAYYADGTTGPIKTRYGIRGIYGKSGADSVPMLEDMIKRINSLYKKGDSWISSVREKEEYFNEEGEEIDFVDYITATEGRGYKRTVEYVVSEGDTSNYWEATAANALIPLHQLLAMAKMRPDGVWEGD